MFKKALFIVLALCLLVPQALADITIYVNNPDIPVNYVYAQDEDGNEILGSWPGLDVSEYPTVTYNDVEYRKVIIPTDKDVITVNPHHRKSYYPAIAGVKDGNYIIVYGDESYKNQGIALSSENFPDANFLAFLESSNCDSDNDGFLSQSEVDAVTRLDCVNKGIASLAGLKYFTNLARINFSQNNVETIDLSHNTNLTWIDCRNNQLTSLDVSFLKSLSVFYCQNNKLTNLDVTKNPSLWVFDCSNNSLSTLDVTHNPRLEEFYCMNTPLTTLDVSQNKILGILHFDKTNISSIDLTNNLRLQVLSFNQCNFSSIDISKNTELRTLSCYSNLLTDVDLSNNTKLRQVNVSSNKLTELDLTKLPELYWILCSNNQLQEIDLTQNHKLYRIDFTSNKLTSIDVSKNEELGLLGVGSNFISEIDVTHNPLLTDLNVEINNISEIDVTKNNVLSKFICSGNNLASLDLSKNPNLIHLGCNKNKLSSLDLSHNPALETLGCSYNELTVLDVSNNPLIKYIYANKNHLVCFDATNLTRPMDYSKTETLRIYEQTRKMVEVYRKVNGEPKYVVPMPSYFVDDKEKNLYVDKYLWNSGNGVTLMDIDGVKCFVSDKHMRGITYDYYMNKDVFNSTTGETSRLLAGVTLTMDEPKAAFTLQGEHNSRFLPEKQLNTYKNLITLHPTFDEDNTFYEGASFSVMRNDTKIATIKLYKTSPIGEEPCYAYDIIYTDKVLDTKNTNIRYDKDFYVTFGFVKNGIKITDYFVEDTSNGGDQTGTYNYSLEEDLLVPNYCVTVPAATIDVQAKNCYTREDVMNRDSDHSLGLVSESVINITPAERNVTTELVNVYNNNVLIQTNYFNTQIEAQMDEKKNEVSCGLAQGNNAWGTNRVTVDLPSLEVAAGDLEISDDLRVDEKGDTIIAYAGSLVIDPTTTESYPVVYYYRVWRICDGKEVLLNTAYQHHQSDYSRILKEYPEGKVTVRDVFQGTKFGNNLSKTIKYLVRMYCANGKVSESSLLKADDNGIGYCIVEQSVDVNFNKEITTGIDGVCTSKNVQSVRYYNTSGQCSDHAFSGINVVVTTYTDGTSSVTKMIK